MSNQLKELWAIRFQRIFNLEYESFYFYKKLIRIYENLLEGSEAEQVLRKIMRDEIRHARAALELIQIVKQREVDNGKLNSKAPKVGRQARIDRK